MKAAVAALALALLLTACGTRDKDQPAPAEELVPIPGSKASVTRTATYSCEGDMPVTAFYGTDHDGNPELSLVISGDDYNLHPTPAPHGARWASARGAGRETGIIWWEDGDQVLLQQAPAKLVDDPAAGVTARVCHPKTDKDGTTEKGESARTPAPPPGDSARPG